MNRINEVVQLRNTTLINWLNKILATFKGGIKRMTEEEKKELNQLLSRIEKQHDTLRKSKREKEYKHLEKTDVIKVYTNDKQAMKFWEE